MYNPDYEKYADQVLVKVKGGPEPSLGDGTTYRRSPWWQSPEGNFYGEERYIMDVYSGWVWNGEDYVEVIASGMRQELKDLPPGPRPHFEIWQVVRRNGLQQDENGLVRDTRAYDYYFFDTVSASWVEITWHNEIYGRENLPWPGLRVGSAHLVIEQDFKVFWDGFSWRLPSHKNLRDDQPERHVPEGFITNYTAYQTNTNGAIQFLQSQQAEARLEFIAKSTLGLVSSILGKTGALWVNNELLLTEDISNVENTDSVLQYSNGTVTIDTVGPDTEYYVYCGNSNFTPRASGLFLSKTPDTDGRLGDETPGTNARIVGVVETDSAGYFIREIDMSYIGKKVEFSQTFWEYSDYQLQFVDEDNLAFNRIDGTHGLLYINGQLLYLGTGKDLNRADYRIEWNDGPDIDTSDISTETTYQIYIANDSVEYNFNNEDNETGFPYEEGHPSYISALDFRRQLFLSTKAHDHRVFNQEYPGYYARHIGQVQTDENGRFRYAADISLIRQPTLNPTHLDGLAECVIQDVSTTQFKVTRKKGTTGIVYVGGKPVQTYDADNPLVHIVSTDDALYEYDETEIDAPLTDSGITVTEKPGIPIYLYLANDIGAWQGVTTFCSLEEPHGGYLSTNWPGNQARWLATIQLSPLTLGSELVTNGSFADGDGWTLGDGWSYVSENQNMLHTPGDAESLSQDVGAVASNLYACTFYITGRTAGISSPKIGGASGLSISGNTSSTQYLLAVNDGDLEIIPDTYFDGSVDNVSVKKVITGQFGGTYIKDSVSGVSAQIDDSIVSVSTTYSSNKIEQIKQQLLAKINLALGLNGSHTTGYELQLEYVDATTIKLKALNSDIDIIFPNLESLTVTTTGIEHTVSGNVDTFYYVYLMASGSLTILTDAPTDIYPNIQFYGETHLLVGWIGFSDTDTISGTHNVYSFWNQASNQWSFSVNRPSSFTASSPNTVSRSAETIATALNGLIIPPGITGAYSFSGGFYGDSSMYYRSQMTHYIQESQKSYCVSGLSELYEGWICTVIRSPLVSSFTSGPIWHSGYSNGDYWGLSLNSTNYISLATSDPILSEGVYHNLTITASASAFIWWASNYTTYSITINMGGSLTITVTRPGNIT